MKNKSNKLAQAYAARLQQRQQKSDSAHAANYERAMKELDSKRADFEAVRQLVWNITK